MADYRIEMYGVFKRLAQADYLTIELENESASVHVLIQQLAEAYPEMRDRLKVTACAVDDELVSRDATINTSQTLALIPPVSGGQ